MSTIDPRWDLAVIGGDRVGHDVAHEAASRGARVVLVMPGAGNADPVGNDQVRVLTGMPRLVGAGELEIVWQWEMPDKALISEAPKLERSQNNTQPIMVDGVLYATSASSQLVALEPTTGKPNWVFNPKSYERGPPTTARGFLHRGASYWTDGKEKRILYVSSVGELYSVDAKTGEPDADFGDAGLVDLVDMDHRISDEIYFEATPGHTPGHVSVHIESEGKHALITGDCIHHPCQIEKIEWSSSADYDPSKAIDTRVKLLEKYVNEDVLIIGTHFATPTAGYFKEVDGHYWLDVNG